MRRFVRILLLVAGTLALLLAASWWSGREPARDAVAEAQRQLGLPLRAAMVPTNGIRLLVVEAGPPDGPPVVLLHGFPEFWWGWKAQVGRLAKAGFRVIVPDQRGYDLSDKPAGVASYRLETLALDVVGVVRQLGLDRVNLGGHDWGGFVAWRVAIAHPEVVRTLAIFNVGHPLAFDDIRAEAGRDDTINWYQMFFQLPWLPELLTPAAHWAFMAKNLRDTSRPGTFPDAEMAYYKSAWARPGAIGGMVNWYRAAFRYPAAVPGDGTVRVPVRIVWGMKDPFMASRLAELSARHCADARVVELPDAGHWLLHEEPERTSREMIELFRATPRA